jgi:hypothetical protein
MKNWFVISFAVMAFLVACGKKDKKQGQIGKSANQSTLDCKGKDKANDACKPQSETTPEAEKGAADQTRFKRSGTDSTPATTETIPNLESSNVMSLHLEENKALAAEFLINADKNDDAFTAVNVSCADLNDLSQNKLAEKLYNADKLENVNTKLYLMNNSQMLATMRINKGDGAGIKPFLVSCKNDSKVNVESYKKLDEFQIKNLDEGMTTLDVVSSTAKGDDGVIVSFQCLSEDDILSEDKKASSDEYVLNRIKLTKGSSVVFNRAINKTFKDKSTGVDKKISELDEKSKNKKHVVVTCK